MVKSASRVLDLLEMFAVIPVPLGVSEVARRLRLPKSSAQALLQTLTTSGYLVRIGLEYEMDPTLKGGGWVGGLRWHLVRLAKPILAESAALSGETVILGLIQPDFYVRYIAKVVSPQAVHYDPALDPPRPTHSCSTGLLHLASLPEQEFEDWLSRTELTPHARNTVTDPKILRAMMPKIREQGYAESMDGYANGASGISYPVIDVMGRMLGAIHLSAPTERYLRDRAKISKEARQAAGRLSKALQALGQEGRSSLL